MIEPVYNGEWVSSAKIQKMTESYPEWILCKEKLPEPGINVLVCLYDYRRRKISKYKDGRRMSIRIDKIDNHCIDTKLHPFWSKGSTPSVIAWMPLPSFYRGDE